MIEIRSARAEDASLLQQVSSTIWNMHYPGLISTDQIDYMLEKMYHPAVIKDELGRGIIWKIAFYDSKPAGYLSYAMNGTDSLKIFKIYVHPEYQRKGIGRMFLEDAKAFARKNKASCIYLNVYRRNETAFKAYLAYGFEKVEEVEIPFGDFLLEDFIMRLPL